MRSLLLVLLFELTVCITLGRGTQCEWPAGSSSYLLDFFLAGFDDLHGAWK